MKISVIRSFKMVLWLTFLTGIVYPLIVTMVNQFAMQPQAQGSLLVDKGKVLGSFLIAQEFRQEKYFWSRPSAVKYNPLPSGGSNLGPTSLTLKKIIEERENNILKSHSGQIKDLIPSDLLYASASGLDPHISIEAVFFQIDRVIKARQFNQEKTFALTHLINRLSQYRSLGYFKKTYVNVLELNYHLDQL